jgi:acetoin utilization deacetylase AcuC-like enzyme
MEKNGYSASRPLVMKLSALILPLVKKSKVNNKDLFMALNIYTHPSGLLHDTGPSHPERQARLTSALAALSDFPTIEAREAELEEIYLAHSADYVMNVQASMPEDGYSALDGDTVISPHSWEAAIHAAGAVCQAVDDVLSERCTRAFCAVRPPGHHAMPDHAMGFCVFNNIFIGARHAQEKHGIDKIAIVDFDVHHGNGTDAMVRKSENIFFASSHQYPFYPGTGAPEMDIAGKTLNVPLSDGSGSEEFRNAYTEIIFPALEKFKPSLLMISAGFDAHKDDPLANISLTEDDFEWVTKGLCNIADKFCGGKIIATLEGGYNLEALHSSIEAHIQSMSKTG